MTTKTYTRADLKKKATTLRIWKYAYKRFDLKLEYNRDDEVGRGFSCNCYGARPSDDDPDLMQIEQYTHYSGDFFEPPSTDVDDTDDPPMELDSALRRVLELEIEEWIANALCDQSMYEAWKEDMRQGLNPGTVGI